MADVFFYGILSLAAVYVMYRVDPEQSEHKYTSIWTFYRSVCFPKKEVLHHN